MNGSIQKTEEVGQKNRGIGELLIEQILGFFGGILMMFYLFFMGLFNGIKHFITGAIVFYFVGGGIAWFLCWVFANMGHAYLGH
jgi:hypothetical protein